MLAAILLASLVGISSAASVGQAASCGFPNGTDTTFNWWQGDSTANFQFKSVVPIDAAGNTIYPVSLKQPLRVRAHFINNQNDFVAGKLLLSMKVFKYGSWSSCDWNQFNTRGLLDDQDACETDLDCPIIMGEHDMIVTIDFSKHTTLIGLLDNDAPYQLQLTLTDQISNTFVTVFTQTRCLTK
ncbi:hypothetical protein PMAYCL1PPCAC_22201 [Pristionchus mayeri]|uniref:MD-2-related lipid-recognition domain-containing protein n=1 Tax=Pristionchus mayeri TaxID=1317129 RepID=A0AAN5I658_9BILA|nr:hypothetical protein PMAYCL1PPCAC_22201 [Pristionchus mayeri]